MLAPWIEVSETHGNILGGVSCYVSYVIKVIKQDVTLGVVVINDGVGVAVIRIHGVLLHDVDGLGDANKVTVYLKHTI